jgi:hypothetical protein
MHQEWRVRRVLRILVPRETILQSRKYFSERNLV